MPLYLAPYIGSGTQADPFIPRGSDQPGWTAVDLRADPTQVAGLALLHLPTSVADAKLIEIGMTKDELIGPAVRTILSNQLGKTLDAGWTLGEALGQLLMFPANGLKPLRPYHGLYEIWLNNTQWFLQPTLAGGASYGDDFNRADGDVGANWTAVPFFIEPTIVSNQLQPVAIGTSWSILRYSAATFRDDQWAEATLVTANGTASYSGPAVRCSDATKTVYYTRTSGPLGSTADGNITKWVSGTQTIIWSFSNRTINAGMVVRLEVRGSMLVRYENGALIQVIADTSIASGWPGLFIAQDGAGVVTDSQLDNWLGGDLEALPINQFDRSRFPKMKLRIPMPTGRQ